MQNKQRSEIYDEREIKSNFLEKNRFMNTLNLYEFREIRN